MPPPTLGQFTRLVRQVLDELPERFHPQMENLVIDVVDEPSAADLRGQPHPERIRSGEDELFGIFHDFSTMKFDVSLLEERPPEEPMNQIKIFRGAHIRTCSSRRELLRQIRATVLHELAHHFGFSEDDLADFESRHAPDE